MIVILPNEDNNVETVIQNLNLSIFESINKFRYIEQVQLSMPKFKIESSMSLSQPLKQVRISKINIIQFFKLCLKIHKKIINFIIQVWLG